MQAREPYSSCQGTGQDLPGPTPLLPHRPGLAQPQLLPGRLPRRLSSPRGQAMGEYYIPQLSLSPSLYSGAGSLGKASSHHPPPAPPPKLRAALGWGVRRVRHLLEGSAELS